MATARISIPRGSSSCLLPPQEAIQDQQMGLTQAPFNLLPLCWDLKCVRFNICPLRAESVSYSSLALLDISPAGFQSQMFWGLIFLMQEPWAGEPDVGLRKNPHSLGRTSLIVIFLPFVDRWPGVVSPDNTVSQPLLLSSLWFLV